VSPRSARRLDELDARITTCALAFESRWSLAALARAEPGLHLRLMEAREGERRARESGDEDEMLRWGEVLCRGYRKCADVMAAVGQPEDAYLIGRDPQTGTKIAIGCVPSAQRVAELHPGMPHYTPDEIATMLANMRGANAVSAVKALFPGAEIVEVRERG
jgi:hypothetical protein